MREVLQHGRIGLAFEGFSRNPGLRHVFTTKDREGGGNLSLSGGRDPEAANAERALWSQWVGANPSDWVVGGQVHGAQIAIVGEAERGRGSTDPGAVIPESDGLVTLQTELPLYVAVADCTAVLLHGGGPQPVLGVAHAGWRGLVAGVLTECVATMTRASGSDAAALSAGVSPCIGLVHFEVGDEVADVAPDTRRVKLEGRWHVDIAGWAHDQLRAAGLPLGHIEVSGLDTHERADLFFSHRRDGEGTGRMGLIAMLSGPPAPAGPPRG